MTLELLRKEMDRLNDDILVLIKKRRLLSKAIAHYKQLHSLPLFDEAREQEQYRWLCVKATEYGLNPEGVKQIFSLIIEEGKR